LHRAPIHTITAPSGISAIIIDHPHSAWHTSTLGSSHAFLTPKEVLNELMR
jgi:hypothetical protein